MFLWTPLEDLSIDVPITNVGLILEKLRGFQLFGESAIGTSQNSISNFFEKNSNFCVSMLYLVAAREDLSINASNTNVEVTSTQSQGDFLSRGSEGYGHSA